VDTVPPLDLSDPAALLRAAAASLGGPPPSFDAAADLTGAATAEDAGTGATAAAGEAGAEGSPAHHTGSAVYLLASMLNHSCEPNLDVTFPHNNGVVRFTAARDIARNEQLTISYIDAEQGTAARQHALEFAYGFRCRCPRCQEGG